MLGDVSALLGKPMGENAALIDSASAYGIRMQQLEMQARETLRRGKTLLAQGDYPGAIAEFTLTLDHIRWAPASVQWGGLESEARELLQRAKDQQQVAAERQRAQSERQAHELLLAEERAEEQRRELRVATLLDDAITAFRMERYDDAMYQAEEVLRTDPRNQQAREIKDSAFRAGREKVKSDYVRQKREQFLLWQERIQEMKIPYTGEITLPSREFWSEITEIRSKSSSCATRSPRRPCPGS
jgi:tetratricopeptide (TPR) repeat protein